MIGDVRLPRRVLEADTIIVSCGLENFERTSLSKAAHPQIRSLDELATVADYDKFAESFENNNTEACNARSLWMIDCRKLDGTDRDPGRNSWIMKSVLGSKDYTSCTVNYTWEYHNSSQPRMS